MLKYNPEAEYLCENVVFDDMPEYWQEACNALGDPIVINAQDHSYTKRNRAYWTNITLPARYKDDFPPPN